MMTSGRRYLRRGRGRGRGGEGEVGGVGEREVRGEGEGEVGGEGEGERERGGGGGGGGTWHPMNVCIIGTEYTVETTLMWTHKNVSILLRGVLTLIE